MKIIKINENIWYEEVIKQLMLTINMNIIGINAHTHALALI